MTDKKYNGWTNYETWRVNLEIFDGIDIHHFCIGYPVDDYDLGLTCKEYATEILESEGTKGLTFDYAMAFLDAVNWKEIAKHLIIQYDEDNDIIECPHCHEKTHIGGLIGENTNDCPKCGKQALFNDVTA